MALEVLLGRGTGAKTAPGGGRNRVVNILIITTTCQGTIGCVPMVFIVFSRDSWGLSHKYLLHIGLTTSGISHFPWAHILAYPLNLEASEATLAKAKVEKDSTEKMEVYRG